MSAKAPTLVVLDDDPTGTQTVYDVPILADWSVETLRAEFERELRCFYILTNSRAFDGREAERINREVARNLKTAAGPRAFTIVSRSDSTLRGHFPLETDVLSAELGPFDGVILIPYFEAGGRVTMGDIHYVKEGERLVPAAQTPFARDAVFGYRSSNLREWVEEKTGGRVRATEVISISLADLQSGVCEEKLRALAGGQYCIVNAARPSDLAAFVAALRRVEREGKCFLFRTAAEFVAAWLGLAQRPLLDGAEWPGGAGLMIMGSYVPKSSEQLRHLLQTAHSLVSIELSVRFLAGEGRDPEIQRVAGTMNEALAAKRDVVVFTSREWVGGSDSAENLRVASSVSAALVEVVRALKGRPRFVIAKGGITSSDLATRGLHVKRAMVQGQILPGVPVWKTGAESRFPDLPYIVFPGNVGKPEALAELWEKLERKA